MPTIEDQILSSAGPTGPPSGPTGPPSGPTGPPSGPTGPPTGPTGPPTSSAEVAEEPPQVHSEDVYEANGDGWYFRKLPDGSYDQTVYMLHEGQYIPYEPTE